MGAYPGHQLKEMLPQLAKLYRGSSLTQMGARQGRNMFSSHVQSPQLTRAELQEYHIMASQGRMNEITRSIRKKRQAESSSTTEEAITATEEQPQTCLPDNEITPARMCKSIFNTTAPMYGVSLTSGEPVTIVQIFPDLLQQVVFEKCDAKECDVLHGECVQTYVPYLFLVIPLGPVTLTGQDYVLVESGCTCRPKFSRPGSDPNPASIIPSF